LNESLIFFKNRNEVEYQNLIGEYRTIFLQFWFILAVYIYPTASDATKVQLENLSVLTPRIAFDSDFKAVGLSFPKDKLDNFNKVVIQELKPTEHMPVAVLDLLKRSFDRNKKPLPVV